MKGQGTIEYLVILAVVVIVALIVVSLMINSTAPAQGISGTTSSIASASNILAVTESIVSEDGNYFLKLKNNSGENITITNITIGENTPAEPNKPIAMNAEEAFILATDSVCSQGQLLAEEVTITYTNQYDLVKKQTYPIPINFECETFTATITYTDETGATHEEDGGIIEPPAGPDCGNGNIDAGEDCDGLNLDGEDCLSQGYDGGVLACSACSFDYSGCTMNPVTLSTYIDDFSGGEFDHAVLGSVTPNGELDWNADARGNEMDSTSSFWDSDLKSVWHLDETSGSTAADAKGTNAGTKYNITSLAGFHGNAYSFNGSSSYVHIGSWPAGTQVTLSAWVKTTSTSHMFFLGTHYTETSLWVLSVMGSGSGNVARIGYKTASSSASLMGTSNVQDGRWHHIVGTVGPTGGKIYVDGVKENENSLPGSWTGGNAAMGRSLTGTSWWYSGLLDEPMVFTSELSEPEVLQLYNEQKGTWQDDDLVAYYKFNGDTTDSARGHHGTAGGSVSYADGLWETDAAQLGTAGDADITIPYNSAWNLTGDSTISFWAYPANETLNDMAISKNTISNPSGGWYIKFSNTRVFMFGGTSGSEWNTGISYSAKEWQHFTIVRDGSTMYAYKNGANPVSVLIASGYPLSPGTPSLVIGGFEASTCCNFDGKIEDVKVYSKSLSAPEVLADYEAGLGDFTSEVESVDSGSEFLEREVNTAGPWYGEELDLNEDLATGLIGLWHLNETSGPTAVDSSGNGNDGTVNSAPQGQPGLWGSTAYNFTSGQYVSAPSIDLTDQATISAWVKSTTSTPDNDNIFTDSDATGPNRRWELRATVTQGFSGYYFTVAQSVGTLQTHIVPVAGQWYHVVMKVNGALGNCSTEGQKMYVNGVLAASTNFCGTIAGLPYSNGTLIGRADSLNRPWEGTIEEVAMWDRELSDEEIKQLFNKGVARIGTQYKVCADSSCSESWVTADDPIGGKFTLTGTGDYFQFKNSFEWVDLGSGQKMHQAYAVLEDVNIIYTN